MIKLLINGFNGKMGQEVYTKAMELNEIEVVAGVDKFVTGEEKVPVFDDISKINVDIDVIIDFSIPIATFNILEFAANKKIPVVVATTGFSAEEESKIKEYSKIIPIFKSANMSYEVNLMADLVAKVAKLLSDSDIEIVETHHNRKIDAPSGTAYMLANSINEALDNEMKYEYDRHSKREKRDKKEIGIHSIRGGTVVGKHTVTFFGDNESFEITHNVTSRSVFANGAVKAAMFLADKEPGLYSMKNMF